MRKYIICLEISSIDSTLTLEIPKFEINREINV